MNNVLISIRKITGSNFVKNSFWGLLANLFQTLFLSIFFFILARIYSKADFGQYLIGTSLYQLIAAFSSMGLGQWYIREYSRQSNKNAFKVKFIEMQIILGFLFLLLHITSSVLLYTSGELRTLLLVLGFNIIFDNILYAFRTINIVESQQKKTAIITLIDGFSKFLISLIILKFPVPLLAFTIVMTASRLMILLFVLKSNSSINSGPGRKLFVKISTSDLTDHIFANWQFAIIGGLSIVYWRLGNLLISKYLTLVDVTNYEISYRIFSIFLLIPVVSSSTVFPKFVEMFIAKDINKLKIFYTQMLKLYYLFSIIIYCFILVFGQTVILYALGPNYMTAVSATREMFCAFLILPAILLQANLIVAMKLEKLDMHLNIFSVILNLTISFVGLQLIKDLKVINYSILISLLIFHILQNAILVKKRITTVFSTIMPYMIFIILVGSSYFFYDYQFIKVIFIALIAFCILAIIRIAIKFQFSFPIVTNEKPFQS